MHKRKTAAQSEIRSRIPLAHPSTLPKPARAPLLSDVPIPENLPHTRIVDQYGNELSPEDLEELEDQYDDGEGLEHDDNGETGDGERTVEVVEEEVEDEFFTTVLMTVPFSFLYLLMDM